MDSAVVPSIPLIPADEERLLREAVAGIASSYGPAYIRSKHDAGLPPSELWDAHAGTNTHNITTRAEPDGSGGYKIRGQKVFSSGVEDAQELMVVARMDDGAGVFIVETDAEGLSRGLRQRGQTLLA